MTRKKAVVLECFRCNNCGNITFSIKKVCPKCGSRDIEVTQTEGKGKVVSFATTYYPPENFEAIAPYTSVLVQLDNECKLFGIIKGEVEDIPEGSPVTATEYDKDAGGAIFFRLD